MLIKLFICQMCGQHFEVKVLDRDDPNERRLPGQRVCCERCGSPRIEELKTVGQAR